MMPRLRLQWGYRSELFPVAAYWRTGLREACVLGAVVVALVPAARGHHDWFGWLPLWLLAMPAAGLLAGPRRALAATDACGCRSPQ
jgi:hypothetical protein